MKNFEMKVKVLAAVKLAEQYEKDAKLKKEGDIVIYDDYNYVVENNLIARYEKYPNLLELIITKEDEDLDDELKTEDEVNEDLDIKIEEKEDEDKTEDQTLPLYNEIKTNEIKTMLDLLGVDYADVKSKKALYKLLEDNYNV